MSRVLEVHFNQSAVFAVGTASVGCEPCSSDERTTFLGERLASGQDLAVALEFGLQIDQFELF